MEAPLMALAMQDTDLTAPVFDLFFTRHPGHRGDFINLGAAAPRMVRECVEALTGLALDEPWAETTIINFVDLHRDYGRYDNGLYGDFIDCITTALQQLSGAAWTDETARMWRDQADRMKAIIARSNMAASATAGN